MTYEKLVNCIYKDLRRTKPLSITRQKLSLKRLKSVFRQDYDTNYIQKHYCCIGEDTNCWTDVEGLDYGWLFLDYPPEKMPKILYKNLMYHVRPHLSKLYGRKVFTAKYKDGTEVIVIPMRDFAQYDLYVSYKLGRPKS